MTRDVSAALAARLLANNTAPAYLLELSFVTATVRYCTYGTLDWNALTWLGKNFSITGLGTGASPVITIFDEDAAIRTLLLHASNPGGLADRPIKIWHGDADALIGSPQGDPVLLFNGVGGASSWARGRATIKCARANAKSTLCPRTRMNAETGYNYLAPKGTEVQWGDKIVRLD